MNKKLFQILIIVLFISIFTTACFSKDSSNSNKEDFFTQVGFEEVNTYFTDGKEGFVLIATDYDEYYIPTVKKISTEEKTQIILYNPYQSDGENDNEGKSLWPDDVNGGYLYYLKDNEIVGELEVNSFENSQLTKEVQNFIDIHK